VASRTLRLRGRLIVFRNDRPPPLVPSAIAKAEQSGVLGLLRSFLDRTEPELMRLLVQTWHRQATEITYDQLKTAILYGGVSVVELTRWQQDYAAFVNERVAPLFSQAILEAASPVIEQAEGFGFDLTTPGVASWIETSAGELIQNLSASQTQAISQLLARAALLGEYGPDELARVIRPLIGLTDRQGTAVLNYWRHLTERGTTLERANSLAGDYAGKLHRYRAQVISRHELATAFNEGQDLAVGAAQAAGLVGQDVQVTWRTAEDERVCVRCLPLDGVTVTKGEDFPGGGPLPPLHVLCRCAVSYHFSSP
jgi:hypothetical protein